MNTAIINAVGIPDKYFQFLEIYLKYNEEIAKQRASRAKNIPVPFEISFIAQCSTK
jgi:hypothetical protein